MPDLGLTHDDLVTETAWFLGWGHKRYDDLSATQRDAIDAIIKSALRRFYYPVMPDGTTYSWSFLTPTVTLTITQAGGGTNDLPNDCGGLLGDLVCTDAGPGARIFIIGEGRIRELRSASDVTGIPRYGAVRPKVVTDGSEQRFELVVYPRPDRDYQVQGRIIIRPSALLEAQRPYGGQQHAETIRESCLAVAEERMNDTQGLHNARFAERLAASVNADRQANMPEFFGRLGDATRYGRALPRRGERVWTVTYNAGP